MKKTFFLVAAFAVTLSFPVMGCSGGKTQAGGNADTSAVDSVKDTTTVENAKPEINEEEVRASVQEACDGVFNYAMSMEVEKAYDYMTPEFGNLFKKIRDKESRTGELILDYDPILGAQDYPDGAKPKIISFEMKSDTEAVAKVRVWKGHNRTLTFKDIDGKWLVDDISGERANLEKLIK